MPVVSVSLPDGLLEDMDDAIDEGEYQGRSEFVRAALRGFLQQRVQRERREGHAHGSITLTYPHDSGARLSEVRHAYDDVVLSLMHTHCEDHSCLDVLLVGGDIERIHALYETLGRMRDVKRTQLAVM